MNTNEIQNLIAEHGHDPLEILHRLNGYYECPKSPDGKRLGHLVGYAAKYEAEKQYVGDVYANFSVAEEYPEVMLHFGRQLHPHMRSHLETITKIVGPQMGGIAIALVLAQIMGKRFAYIEKKITQLATDVLREQSELKFIRHTVGSGEKICIAEDVLNNFATTSETIAMIESIGAEVVLIVGLLNRSPKFENFYPYKGREIPIAAMVRRPFPEYKQNDPAVIDDMIAGNVILKPKNEWARLMEDMNVKVTA